MDGAGIDTLTRFLTTARSRRQALLAASGGLGLLTLGTLTTDAKNRKRKRKGKHKRRNGGQSPPLSPPDCPTGTRACNGSCIPSTACCASSECTALNEACKIGVCTAEGACVAVNAYEGFFCIDFDTTCGPQDDCECISGVCTFN